ncbi:hypothetical protein B0H11DRAFT_2218165 [Mycena galericulata]|nr:hypothetical protein B0H11DRAFT_2218165 [Mycena galericulata]
MLPAAGVAVGSSVPGASGSERSPIIPIPRNPLGAMKKLMVAAAKRDQPLVQVTHPALESGLAAPPPALLCNATAYIWSSDHNPTSQRRSRVGLLRHRLRLRIPDARLHHFSTLFTRYPRTITPGAVYLRAATTGMRAPKRFVHAALEARGPDGKGRTVWSGCWPHAPMHARVV